MSTQDYSTGITMGPAAYGTFSGRIRPRYRGNSHDRRKARRWAARNTVRVLVNNGGCRIDLHDARGHVVQLLPGMAAEVRSVGKGTDFHVMGEPYVPESWE